MDVSVNCQQWMAGNPWQRHDSFTAKFDRAADAAPLSIGPVLPRIASLLHSVEPSDEREIIGKRRLSVAEITGDKGANRLYWEPSRLLNGSGGMKRWRSSSFAAARIWDHESALSDVPALSSVKRPTTHQEFGSRGDTVAASSTTTATTTDHGAIASVPRVDQPLPQSSLDAHKRVRPMPLENSSCSLPQMQMQPMSLDSPLIRQKRDSTGRQKLFYHLGIDPPTIHVLTKSPLSPPIHQDSTLATKYLRTSRSFYRQMSTSSVHANSSYQTKANEVTTSVKKRRRVVAPTTSSRQPRYESEHGLALSGASKPLMRSRYDHSNGSVVNNSVSASRQRHVQGNLGGMEIFDSPNEVDLNLNNSSNEEVVIATAPSTEAPAPALSTQINVIKCELLPHSTLVRKSKEFLTSNNFVRNRHGELDWVATFLNVGFDSSSIYALMCPQRKGRWKLEEESYTMGLLQLIENGTIILRHGQSIRGYIGEKLHSDAMRVLKKLSNCKMFRFAKLINPRLAEQEDLDMSAVGAREGLRRLDQLRGEFLRSVQLEALVAVRKHLSDSSLRDLLSVRA